MYYMLSLYMIYDGLLEGHARNSLLVAFKDTCAALQRFLIPTSKPSEALTDFLYYFMLVMQVLLVEEW